MPYSRFVVVLLLTLLLVGCASGAAPAPDSMVERTSSVSLPVATSAPMMGQAFAVDEADVSLPEGTLASNQQQIERLIIKNADLTLRVKDVTAAADQVSQIASEAQGFVLSSSTNGTDAQHTAYVSIRVPADRFEATLSRLEGLAVRVLSRSVSGEDVTEEYVDLEARLRNLEATRDRLLDLLDQAARVQDALEINQALSDVQGQIEQLQGRLRYLEQSAALSTINVLLEPVPTTQVVTADGWQPLEVARAALRNLLGFAQVVANLLITLVIWSPVLLVGGVASWQGVRFVSRKMTRRKADSGDTPAPTR